MKFLRKKSPSTSSSAPPPPTVVEQSSSGAPVHYAFTEILKATRNFDDSLVIAEGGFGFVYRCEIRVGDRLVAAAIKRLIPGSDLEKYEPCFLAEVDVLTKYQHDNIVRLLGFCNYNKEESEAKEEEGAEEKKKKKGFSFSRVKSNSAKPFRFLLAKAKINIKSKSRKPVFCDKERILVYEYVGKANLQDHLHKLKTPFSYHQRLSIARSIGLALEHLHTRTPKVIHSDLKPSNVLLGANGVTKLSDFGLAQECSGSCIRHILPAGTLGYMDMEYFVEGILSTKSDVYSFGVILLELLFRKPVTDGTSTNLVDWFRGLMGNMSVDAIRNTLSEIDPQLQGEASDQSFIRFIRIARRCVDRQPGGRPNMADVLAELEYAGVEARS